MLKTDENAIDKPRGNYKTVNPDEIIRPNRALRQRSKKAQAKLERNIRHYNVIAPLIVDTDFNLLDGFARLQAARKIGLDAVPVIVVDGLSPAELKALSLSLNRLAEDADWDRDAVADSISTILEIEPEFEVELTGFEVPEIDILLDNCDSRGRKDTTDEDVPLRPGNPISRPGDVFVLGAHRLVCGDVREPNVLSALTIGERADMVITDPPYNVRIDGHATGAGRTRHREFPMASGEMSEPEFEVFLAQSLKCQTDVCRDGALVYVFMDWRHGYQLESVCRTLGLDQINLCVWAKTNGGMGSYYRSQHELVFVYRKGKTAHRNNIELGRHGRDRTNVWTYDGVNTLKRGRRAELALHPTVKPVVLVEDAIKDCTRRGDVVVDGFLGSGTTLLACERSDRVCRGVELDPGYVDVAIERWEVMTGHCAVHEETGFTFDELRARRHRRHVNAA